MLIGRVIAVILHLWIMLSARSKDAEDKLAYTRYAALLSHILVLAYAGLERSSRGSLRAHVPNAFQKPMRFLIRILLKCYVLVVSDSAVQKEKLKTLSIELEGQANARKFHTNYLSHTEGNICSISISVGITGIRKCARELPITKSPTSSGQRWKPWIVLLRVSEGGGWILQRLSDYVGRERGSGDRADV